MKRLALLLALSLLCGLAVATSAEYALTSYKSAFDIQNQNSRQMDISFTLPEFTVNEDTQGDQTYHRISLPGTGTLMQSGMPELPVITTSIAIPYQGGVTIEVLSSQHTILTEYNAYPLQQGQELESPKAFIKNSDYYSSGGSYPSAAVQYSDPMILRDFRIVTLQINPFSYNAATQELSIYNNIELRVSFTTEPSVNELSFPVSAISPSFDKIYSSIIQNYDDYRQVYSNTPPRYLIIHGNTTDSTFLSALDEYVLWKRQKGADVSVANTSSSQAGSSTSSIQTYIRNQYNNPSTRPDFVILIGDTSGSYTVPAFTNNGGGTDYPYTHMNTGDILGDIFIGRISVENISQFLVLMNKIYLYERDLDLTTADWLNHMLLVGDNNPSGISTMYISKFIKEMALEENPGYTFTEIYSGAPAPAAMNAAINQGIGFFSFRGYIGMSGWAPPQESSLFNGFKLPHAVIITCSTGNYWNGTGHTEAFIRLGSTAAPKGAVTAIGMSTSSTHTTFNNVLHGAIFEGTYTYGMRTMGEALLHGKLYMNQIFGVSSPVNAEKFAHWCNLMGDPTMEVYTGIPSSFQIATDASIPIGLTLLDVAVTDADGLAVEGASVVLSQGSEILARGYTDVEGNVVLMLPTSLTAGMAKLTASRHNFKPLQSDIEIVAEDTLVPAAIIVDDDNTGASSGNENGIATASESLEIFFGLLNTGTETVSGISGTVTSESPWINIVQGNISYPEIMGGATGNNLSPIVVEVAPDTPHETLLRLHLILTDSNDEAYDVSEFIEVEAARILFNELSVLDADDNLLDPDENAGINITFSNAGPATVENIYARLYTENDLISVTDNTAYLGTIAGGATVSITEADNFSVWLRPETLPGMVMPMHVRLYNDAGFEQFVPFTVTVGSVTSTDPLGPDNYGYVIYDWTDAAYPEAAVYDWFEIAPELGGLGTPVSVSDIYNGSDEGDQVGAQSVGSVSLPFPFQFYGRLYDQITVCSNGFLAMGLTENGEFRNFRLPGAMGPSPMIAPFWDDLATHSGGGIYTYFDRNNHSFIIEWYNLKNGKNGTSPETFQVILYDQATYNTSLGDGPIKFQYHTFNNVNSQSGNNHGNYCTIGIEDHSGTRGLEYSFNNTYPNAAAQLSDGKALYITNVPTYYEAANILIEETYISDNNSAVEPGESISMGVQLQNSGNVAATGINAVLSTEDPFVSMVNGVSEYFDLEPNGSGVNRSPFTFDIAADCPNDYNITFNLAVTSGEVSWNRMFSVHVEANKLQYHSFMISDYNGNYDGVVDSGEEVQLVINLQNASAVEAREVAVLLSTDQANLIIDNPEFTIQNIAPNHIMQVVFDLDFSGVSGAGAQIPVHFGATPLNGDPISIDLNIPFNLPDVENDFELDNGRFVSETGWAWGNPTSVSPYSGSKVWATSLEGQYPNNVLYHLYTPHYVLAENSNLSFMHYYNTEADYDGVNLSISTDNGQNWTVITPNGGYPGSGIAGLGNQAGWTGNSGSWVNASFDLAAYSNQEVMFRFRLGSNGAVTAPGWFIDDFHLAGVNLKTGFLHGTVYSSSGADTATATVSSNQHYTSSVKGDGSFVLYLPNGIHSATAAMPNHQNSTQNNIHINPDSPVLQTEFTLIDLPMVQNLSFNVDNDTGIFTMLWDVPVDPVLPITGYRVYRRFDSGPFTMANEATETNYTETFVLEGEYDFYVVPMYMDHEGSPSAIVNAAFPYTGTQGNSIPGLVTALDSNYPNPFNPSTTIRFSLAEAGHARLNIYNTRGQLVRSLANSNLMAGKHQMTWDGRDNRGKSVASGIYFYRLQAGKYVQSRKMILMK